MTWLRRFTLHLFAAIGALAIFVGAVTIGVQQNRSPAPAVAAQAAPAATQRVRSMSGTIREVTADAIVLQMARGRQWRVAPFPGALIRLNGRGAALTSLAPGDRVTVIGVFQDRESFQAHAITARRPK